MGETDRKIRKCQARVVSMRAIAEKLEALKDRGVDIDALPLDWSIEQLMQYQPEASHVS